jgi:hypothetical protein
VDNFVKFYPILILQNLNKFSFKTKRPYKAQPKSHIRQVADFKPINLSMLNINAKRKVQRSGSGDEFESCHDLRTKGDIEKVGQKFLLSTGCEQKNFECFSSTSSGVVGMGLDLNQCSATIRIQQQLAIGWTVR